jgi:hypothetical protein
MLAWKQVAGQEGKFSTMFLQEHFDVQRCTYNEAKFSVVNELRIICGARTAGAKALALIRS